MKTNKAEGEKRSTEMLLSSFGSTWVLITTVLLLQPLNGMSLKEPSQPIPSIEFNDLKKLVEDDSAGEDTFAFLKDGGGKLGAFSVSHLPSGGSGLTFASSVASVRSKAPACLGSDSSLPSVSLSDGSTRRTFATETRTFPACLFKELEDVADAFDELEAVVSQLLKKVAGRDLGFVSGETGKFSPLSSAPHKDHLHLYKKKAKTPSSFSSHWRHTESFHAAAGKEEESKGDLGDYLIPFHVDNGIFLIITNFPEHPLMVRLSDGSNTTVPDESAEVLVLLGRGLTDWLLQEKELRKSFFAVPHAVSSMNIGSLTYRMVYARMKVMPHDAVPSAAGEKESVEGELTLKTFRDFFMGKEEKGGGWKDSQVCSADLSERDPWVKAMDSNCAKGEAYCWMGCYPLPSACPSVDDAVCFSRVTNITCSTEPEGRPMDPTCQWECKPDDPAKYKISNYCNGKMDMLMFGFDVSGNKQNPCIVLFVEAWTLNTRAKFAAGCVGVMLLGFVIEALIALRRNLIRKKFTMLNIRAVPRKALALFLFSLNLTLGYLAMLVAMTYSIELFFFVILGLLIGHGVFNLNIAVGESIDPCCASQNDVTNRKKEVDRNYHVDQNLDPSSRDRDTLLMINSPSNIQSPVSNGTCCTKRDLELNVSPAQTGSENANRVIALQSSEVVELRPSQNC